MSAHSSESDAASKPAQSRLINRAAALGLMAFAALLIFWIIPNQVDTASYGWMKPRTLPYICGVMIGSLSLLLLIFPQGQTSLNPPETIRAFCVLAALGLALWAMAWVGFLWVAPVLALGLILALGERRPLWIAATVLVIPGLIWFVVEWLLGRALP